MKIDGFDAWCERAVALIKYKPDRKKIQAELHAHIEDKYEALAAGGMTSVQAEEQAVSAMGDAGEIAKALAKIHKPFWGYMLRLTKIVLAFVAVLMIFSLAGFSDRVYICAEPDSMFHAERFENGNYNTSECVFSIEPNVSASCDGYTFTVTKAALWHDEGILTDEEPIVSVGSGAEGESAESYTLYYLMTVTSPLPWAEYAEIPRRMYAVDSLGNYYYSCYDNAYTDELALRGNPYRTSYFTYTYSMWTNSFASQDAQWLEFRYERDGRSIALRVDFPGGETS
jgi:hypothetical protein